jgi:hypothetical protein
VARDPLKFDAIAGGCVGRAIMRKKAALHDHSNHQT